MTQPAISAHDLTYSYGDNLAVDHVSFDVAPGEIFALLGPNGAGKSTLVRLLTGQVTPSEGSAAILGMDVVRQRKAVQAQIGVSFENTNLYEQMSAVENLDLFARLYGLRRSDGDFEPLALLEKVGLAGRERERVAGYSKGMKQRLMLARALVSRPRILFLDEPTDGLDPVSSQTIHGIIRESVAAGTTVFLTTHDMVEADKLSDRVAFINRGRIVALDTPARLKRQYGQRALRVELEQPDGATVVRELPLDGAETAEAIYDLLRQERVLTVHSEEATLEDIFIDITGRGLQA
ncbi:MAG: ABC transporter ATP-binding protein [Candidatus Promineifilaceae bacterium]|nr:ABC transporter ATP-binding protein [Candidatus Promineifilaceae bacterium]